MECSIFDASERTFKDTTKYPNGAIQGAIDAASAAGGGTVYIPADTHDFSTTLVIDHAPDNKYAPVKPLVIQGAGTNATVLRRRPGPPYFDLLHIRRSFVTVRDLAFKGNAPIAAMDGIRIGNDALEPGEPVGFRDVRNVILRNVIVQDVYGYALRIVGARPSTVVPPVVKDCAFVDCNFAQNGFNASGVIRVDPACFNLDFQRCVVDFYYGKALELIGCEGVTLDGFGIDSAQNNGTPPYIYANEAINCRLLNGWIEEPTDATGTPRWFVQLDGLCHGWIIDSTVFNRQVGTVPKAILIGNASQACRGVIIVNPLIRTSAGLPTSHHIEVVNSASDVQVIGGIATGGAGPNPPFTEIQVYSDPGAPARTMIHNDQRFRVGSVDGALPTGYLRSGDVIVDGGALKMWNGSAWKRVLTEA